MTREKFLELESQLNYEHTKMVEERAELLGLGTVEGLQKAQELNDKINLNISNHEKLIMEYCASFTPAVEEQPTVEVKKAPVCDYCNLFSWNTVATTTFKNLKDKTINLCDHHFNGGYDKTQIVHESIKKIGGM